MTQPSTRRVLAEGRHIRLVEENGWEYAERVQASGIVIIVAVTPESRILLVEQYRRPVKSRVLELPAGLAGDLAAYQGEDLAKAARRELMEETGYEAETMTPLTVGPPTAGLATEIVTFFRATGLKKTGPGGGDETEGIVVHEVPLADVEGWLSARTKAGDLIDPKVYAGLYFARQKA
jgi:ADP-ribose pyrophosphatase